MTDLLATLAWIFAAGIVLSAVLALIELVRSNFQSPRVLDTPSDEDCINGFMGDSLRTRRDRDKEGGWAIARRTPSRKRDTISGPAIDALNNRTESDDAPEMTDVILRENWLRSRKRDTLTSEGLDSEGRG